MTPRIAILKTDGTNCDHETAYAFTKAGGHAITVSLNHLKSRAISLTGFDILAIPGGFSYGDDIASGKVFALELLHQCHDELAQFIEQKKLIIGICNGFQVLTQLGLLPVPAMGNKQLSLIDNRSGKFECRWITMRVEKSPCVFTRELVGAEITLPVAHGEGQVHAEPAIIEKLENDKLSVLQYTDQGQITQAYPENPNGSVHALAGICDPTGRIFGLMPHPERYIEYYHLPQWRRMQVAKPHGLSFFESAINYCK